MNPNKINQPEHPAIPLRPPEVPPIPPVFEPELRRELGAVLQAELKAILPAIALVYLFLAWRAGFREGSPWNHPLVLGNLLAAGYSAMASLLIRIARLRSTWSHAIAGGLATLFLGICFLQFTVHPSPHISLPLLLGLIAIGHLFIFTEWYLFLTLAGAALWFAFAWSSNFAGLWQLYQAPVAAALVLGGWIHWNRSRTLRMLQTLRLEESPQRVHLTRTADDASRYEKRFRGLWDAGFDALVLHDHGKILDANDSLTRLLGYERSELAGKHFSDVLAEDSKAQFATTAQFGNFQTSDAVGIRQDGSRIHLHLFNKPVPWGEDQVSIMSVRDLTEQKQQEAATRQEKDRMELVVRRQAVLTQIELAAVKPGNLDDLGRQVVEASSTLLRASIGSCLILADSETQSFTVRFSTIPDLGPCVQSLSEIRPESALGYVIENKEPLIVSTTRVASFSLEKNIPVRGVGAFAAFPVVHQDAVTGVLIVLEREPRHYTPEELGFLEILSKRLDGFVTHRETEERLRDALLRVEEQDRQIHRLQTALASTQQR